MHILCIFCAPRGQLEVRSRALPPPAHALRSLTPLSLPLPRLPGCLQLKRVNLGKLALDSESDALSKAFEKMVLGKSDGIFWGTDGVQKKA